MSKAHQETVEEEDEEEDEETLQRRPRQCEIEQHREGSGPGKDSIPIPQSTVVEPRPEVETTETPEAVSTVQHEPELEQPISSGLNKQQRHEERRSKQTPKQED